MGHGKGPPTPPPVSPAAGAEGGDPASSPCPGGQAQACAPRPRAVQDEDRIIGGYPCVPYSQPWQVYIYEPVRCGGILLRPRWVLSAGHCLYRGLRVRLGENDLEQAEGTEQERRVLRAFRHPAFDPTTLDNDLLLLQLDRPVRLSRAVQPLALPRSCAPPGTTCLVSGWGTVTTPQGERLEGAWSKSGVSLG
ncbi:LOW QUALITY PROTEIN: kallikrein-14-like [Cygnus atratus]|uniref:LOW QUALITY PROTEIN: kallikrein-14-like n=1 Tax=Cygnus atratus TaxID=8868 RepID=UPI0021B72F71|nr:LOW QUALITY PROTEIN: kallikrein-14-like [Cygnus atratus]